jgi:hypothetical protein
MATKMKALIEQLDEFCKIAHGFANEHRDAGREGELAFYYYGRCVSCFMGVKTLLFSLDKAGSLPNFEEMYIESLPSTFQHRDIGLARRYINETHAAIRFVLFHNFYSQTEFTYKIIQRDQFPDEFRRNPYRLIEEKYKILPDKFPLFLNDIRNTIHNNGFFFPDDFTNKEHHFNGKTYQFIQGKRMDIVNIDDIFAIINYLLVQNSKLFKDEKLASIKF